MDNEKKRLSCPVGLSILATFNMLAAAIGFLGILLVPIFIFINSEVFPKPDYISFSIKIIFSVLYLVSGIGYFRVRWYQGYVLGNITAIAALLSIAFSFVMKRTVNLDLVQQLFLKLIFPTVTLFLLNVRYRSLFKEARVVSKNVSKT